MEINKFASPNVNHFNGVNASHYIYSQLICNIFGSLQISLCRLRITFAYGCTK